MTSSSEIIFQTDSEIVKQQYKTAKNYLIEYTTDDTSPKGIKKIIFKKNKEQIT
ncbi:hypothetical protein [uncultured Maribacter sp.]|uniref:hypothetical protein n=1 Tax=uncultured Maribacter sp. TaxID=431308 RepID=UPI002636CD79|nr:hypothetical protein [uncultured Maribacter sp.]